MSLFSRLLIAILLIATVSIGLLGWSYSNVKSDLVDVNSIEPRLIIDPQRAIPAFGQFLTGNSVQTPLEYIEGITIKGTINVCNDSYIPVYVPGLEHQLFVKDVPVGETFYTKGSWLGPRGQLSVPVEIILLIKELPQLVCEYIFEEGNLPLDELESSLRIGAFSFSKTSSLSESFSYSFKSIDMVIY